MTTKQKQSALLRMDNIGIVVQDLPAVTAFFVELGLEIEGQTTVEGPSVDRLIALHHVRSDIVMLRTPDGHSRLELSKFHTPTALPTDPNTPVNTQGIRRLMFAVTGIDDVVTRLKKHGADLLGEMVNYENIYQLSY